MAWLRCLCVTTLVIFYLLTSALGGIVGGSLSALGNTIGGAARSSASAVSGALFKALTASFAISEPA